MRNIEKIKLNRIRPGIYEDESLSSYLMRVADWYSTDLKNLLKWYRCDAAANRKVSSIDFRGSIINIELLSSHMNLTLDKLRDSTLYNTQQTLMDFNDTSEWTFIGDSFEQRVRKYCPECLKEHVFYPLFWQIKDLHICPKHHVKLENTCSQCNEFLPYADNGLGRGVCPKCHHSLKMKDVVKCIDDLIISEQLKVYENWRSILSANKYHIPCSFSLSKGRYLALKLLYISQGSERRFDRREISLNSDFTHRLINYIKKGKEERKTYVVTLPMMRKLLRGINISVKDFLQVEVPKEYIESLLKEDEKSIRGTCLSPWCPNFGKSTGLIPINNSNKKLKINNTIIKHPHICAFCSLKFGFNNKGQWIEIENFIDFVYRIGVPILNKGGNMNDLANSLEISFFKANGYTAYFLQHQLVNEKVIKRYRTQNFRLNPIPCFQKLVKIKGSKIQNAKRIYGWSRLEYHYHFHNPTVRLIITEPHFVEIFNTEKNNEKSVRTVAKEQIMEEEKEKVWEKAKSIITYCVEKQEMLVNETFYWKLGRGKKWIVKYIPELAIWFEQQKISVNNKNRSEIERIRVNNAVKVICEFYRVGNKLSLENIYQEVGISKKFYRTHGLIPILKGVIYALEKKCLSVEELQQILETNPELMKWNSYIV